MPEFTPRLGIASVDPEQLPLGWTDHAANTSAPDAARGDAEADSAVALREPPVCGEWSFDTADDSESRGGAKLVDGKTTGAAPPVAMTAASSMPRAVGRTVASPPQMIAPRIPSPRPAPAPLPPPAPTRIPSPAPAATPATPATPAARASHASPMPSPIRSTANPRMMTPPTPLPAFAELKSVHEAHPGDAGSAIALATALDKRGNIEGALTVLLRAIDAGADAVTLRCARATILSGRLRYDDSEAELKRAAKVRADDVDVLLQQGILACRRAKWRDAVEPLSRLVKINPLSGPAHFYLGEALNKIDSLQDAYLAYERAAELEPENWRALKGVGIVLDRMGRPADAATFYRRARDAQGG
jgi:Tfp pilus assembly protein PilF